MEAAVAAATEGDGVEGLANGIVSIEGWKDEKAVRKLTINDRGFPWFSLESTLDYSSKSTTSRL